MEQHDSQVIYNPYKSHRSRSRKRSARRSRKKEQTSDKKKMKREESGNERSHSKQLSARRQARMKSSRARTNFSMNLSRNSILNDSKNNKKQVSKNQPRTKSTTKNTFFASLNSSGIFQKPKKKEERGGLGKSKGEKNLLFKNKRKNFEGLLPSKTFDIKTMIQEKRTEFVGKSAKKGLNFNLKKDPALGEMGAKNKIKGKTNESKMIKGFGKSFISSFASRRHQRTNEEQDRDKKLIVNSRIKKFSVK